MLSSHLMKNFFSASVPGISDQVEDDSSGKKEHQGAQDDDGPVQRGSQLGNEANVFKCVATLKKMTAFAIFGNLAESANNNLFDPSE